MKREIEFRGKTAKGEWVYGYYVYQRERKGAFGQQLSDLDRERNLR